MHDIAIRGGTILDGTGAAAFTGDLAIDGATIAQVGGNGLGRLRVVETVVFARIDAGPVFGVRRPPRLRTLLRSSTPLWSPR